MILENIDLIICEITKEDDKSLVIPDEIQEVEDIADFDEDEAAYAKKKRRKGWHISIGGSIRFRDAETGEIIEAEPLDDPLAEEIEEVEEAEDDADVYAKKKKRRRGWHISVGGSIRFQDPVTGEIKQMEPLDEPLAEEVEETQEGDNTEVAYGKKKRRKGWHISVGGSIKFQDPITGEIKNLQPLDEPLAEEVEEIQEEENSDVAYAKKKKRRKRWHISVGGSIKFRDAETGEIIEAESLDEPLAEEIEDIEEAEGSDVEYAKKKKRRKGWHISIGGSIRFQDPVTGEIKELKPLDEPLAEEVEEIQEGDNTEVAYAKKKKRRKGWHISIGGSIRFQDPVTGEIKELKPLDEPLAEEVEEDQEEENSDVAYAKKKKRRKGWHISIGGSIRFRDPVTGEILAAESLDEPLAEEIENVEDSDNTEAAYAKKKKRRKGWHISIGGSIRFQDPVTGKIRELEPLDEPLAEEVEEDQEKENSDVAYAKKKKRRKGWHISISGSIRFQDPVTGEIKELEPLDEALAEEIENEQEPENTDVEYAKKKKRRKGWHISIGGSIRFQDPVTGAVIEPEPVPKEIAEPLEDIEEIEDDDSAYAKKKKRRKGWHISVGGSIRFHDKNSGNTYVDEDGNSITSY